ERRLSREQPKPRDGVLANEIERSVGPEGRHLVRAQRPARCLLSQSNAIILLVVRRTMAGDERFVEAARAGVVADVEVGTELRRRQVKFTSDRVVADADRQEHEQAASDKDRGPKRPAL